MITVGFCIKVGIVLLLTWHRLPGAQVAPTQRPPMRLLCKLKNGKVEISTNRATLPLFSPLDRFIKIGDDRSRVVIVRISSRKVEIKQLTQNLRDLLLSGDGQHTLATDKKELVITGDGYGRWIVENE